MLLHKLRWPRMHACTNFFKSLQGSSNFCKTQHVLYFLNVGCSRISNIPVCHEGHKGHEGHEDISAYLHFSAFLFISLHFSSFLCISMNLSAFIWISLISLHFSAFYMLSFRTIWRSVPSSHGRHFFSFHKVTASGPQLADLLSPLCSDWSPLFTWLGWRWTAPSCLGKSGQATIARCFNI